MLALLGACAPAVLHGPRVEPGLRAGATAGLPLLRDTANGPDAVIPNWAPFVMYGLAGKSGGAAGSVSLSTGGRDGVGAQGDVYLQLPGADPARAYGVGVVGSNAYAMPYGQLGRDLGRGWEVYTTQALVWRWDYTDKRISLDVPSVRARPRYWAPAVALRRRERVGALTVEVAGAFGSFRERTAGPADGRFGPAGPARPLRTVTVRFGSEIDVAALLGELAAVTRRPVPRDSPP